MLMLFHRATKGFLSSLNGETSYTRYIENMYHADSFLGSLEAKSSILQTVVLIATCYPATEKGKDIEKSSHLSASNRYWNLSTG